MIDSAGAIFGLLLYARFAPGFSRNRQSKIAKEK
jgi:hypothetical protein